ncbi:MAG: hypothetical protein MZU91_00255 [Desulfosudis oleivorans]|nr:hypothetical protein [Desulfosudis oleivorans]
MASRYKGYMGKILDVDLSTGKVGTYDLSDRDRERFIGGGSYPPRSSGISSSPGSTRCRRTTSSSS